MHRVFDMSSGQVLETHQAASGEANQSDTYCMPELQLQLNPHLSCEERQMPPGPVIADLNALFKQMG